jgi:hypothetical protein
MTLFVWITAGRCSRGSTGSLEIAAAADVGPVDVLGDFALADVCDAVLDIAD